MATKPPRKPYKTDVTDAQWALLEPLIPAAKHGGRPRTVDLREVINTLFYQSRTGVQWELLPHDLLPKSTAYDYFVAWRDDGTWQRLVDALRGAIRQAEGRDETPSAGCIDSQTVKTTGLVTLEKTPDGILVRPCPPASWDDIFADKLPVGRSTPGPAALEVRPDDLLF